MNNRKIDVSMKVSWTIQNTMYKIYIAQSQTIEKY